MVVAWLITPNSLVRLPARVQEGQTIVQPKRDIYHTRVQETGIAGKTLTSLAV